MLKIKTTKLQEMLSRAIKGAGDNNLIPLTSLMSIELKDGKLTITTTDNTNYLYVLEDVEGDDFYVCLGIDKFPKLVARTTSEDIALDLKDKYLEVIGNGKYQIEFQLDENGEMIKFPNPLNKFEFNNKIGEVELTTIKSILTVVRPALEDSVRVFSNYYVGDAVTATDAYKINSMAVKLFEEPRLISSQMMDLLDTMIDDTIEIYAEDNKLVFKTKRGVVYGYTSDGIKNFKIDDIMAYMKKDYPSNCKVSKLDILQILDRLSLFVDALGSDTIHISFEEDGLRITSNKSDGAEKLSYIECNNFEPCEGEIRLERFRTQVKAQSGDAIEIHFGDTKSIKMIDNKTTLVVALGND